MTTMLIMVMNMGKKVKSNWFEKISTRKKFVNIFFFLNILKLDNKQKKKKLLGLGYTGHLRHVIFKDFSHIQSYFKF